MMNPIHVLLVEDNPADVDLTRESLENSKVHVQISVAWDGVEALDFVMQRGKFREASKPDLVLLDLNLPKIDGRAVLKEMKQHKALRRIPVVILTSSEAETDIVKSYDLGANCYITKPVSLLQFEKIVRSIESFWFMVVKLPPDPMRNKQLWRRALTFSMSIQTHQRAKHSS